MQNEMLKLIETRRSIRKYQKKQITDEELDAVLTAGSYAPTGKGAQDVQIVAVQDEETRKRLTRMNSEILGKDIDPYYAPPTIVLAFAHNERRTCVQDGSCALMNMLLAAHALGLGACWINREREMFDTPEGKALMEQWGVEHGMVGVGAISLGYPEGQPPRAAKRKPGYIIKV